MSVGGDSESVILCMSQGVQRYSTLYTLFLIVNLQPPQIGGTNTVSPVLFSEMKVVTVHGWGAEEQNSIALYVSHEDYFG